MRPECSLGSPRVFFCAFFETRSAGDDQVQARIHLARRLRARSQPPQQDEGQGVRGLPDARGAPDLGLRRQLDAPGGGHNSDCLLKPVAIFPDPARANGALVMCEVLLPDGTPHPSNSRATIPDDPGHVVRLRAGVLPLSGRRAARLPARRASRRRRASTTPASATRTSATSPARSSTRTSTSASRRASSTRASTPRWRRASGSSRSSARARSAPPTRCGSPGICSCGSASGTAST